MKQYMSVSSSICNNYINQPISLFISLYNPSLIKNCLKFPKDTWERELREHIMVTGTLGNATGQLVSIDIHYVFLFIKCYNAMVASDDRLYPRSVVFPPS